MPGPRVVAALAEGRELLQPELLQLAQVLGGVPAGPIAALERVEKGTYGICEYSGEPIPKERLQAIPYARERVEYKTRSFR